MPNQLMHLAIDFETTKFIVQVGRFNLSSSPSWWSSYLFVSELRAELKAYNRGRRTSPGLHPSGNVVALASECFFTDNYSLSFVRNRMLEQRVHRSSTMMSSSFIKVESMSSMK